MLNKRDISDAAAFVEFLDAQPIQWIVIAKWAQQAIAWAARWSCGRWVLIVAWAQVAHFHGGGLATDAR